ncbi:hypothetical protein [Neglectibacter timonensis]|uniref:hypothetical protein n=1 Tax=Neglectibacter timonensis TaxID=1776382 RepID=UPI0039962AFB
MNPTEKINIIHIPHENTPVKLEFEFLAMTVPYRELYSQSFPEYIQKIEDVLTYDKKQNLSHGVLVRRFPSQEGMVVYRNKVNQLIKWQVQDISKLGLVFGREHLPIQVIPAPSRKRGRPRRDDGER